MAYFANGTEGACLENQCSDCPLGYGWNDPNQGELFEVEREPRGCPVYFVQMEFNYDQINKGNEQLRAAMNLLVDDKRGECQVRKHLVDIRKEGES